MQCERWVLNWRTSSYKTKLFALSHFICSCFELVFFLSYFTQSFVVSELILFSLVCPSVSSKRWWCQVQAFISFRDLHSGPRWTRPSLPFKVLQVGYLCYCFTSRFCLTFTVWCSTLEDAWHDDDDVKMWRLKDWMIFANTFRWFFFIG